MMRNLKSQTVYFKSLKIPKKNLKPTVVDEVYKMGYIAILLYVPIQAYAFEKIFY